MRVIIELVVDEADAAQPLKTMRYPRGAAATWRQEDQFDIAAWRYRIEAAQRLEAIATDREAVFLACGCVAGAHPATLEDIRLQHPDVIVVEMPPAPQFLASEAGSGS